MLSAKALRNWAWFHKWTSLICTVFMLLLGLTGLPLIFHHEIGHLLGTEIEAPEMPADTPHADLDNLFATAQARAAGKVPQFAFLDDDGGNMWYFSFGDTPDDQKNQKSVVVDARTGAVLGEPKFDEGFMYIMFKLHVDLFADLPGKLFLGLMGLLLLIAIVSGVVLYAPFMRKISFGSVRRQRSNRIKWLDLHNLLGIVTVVWLFAVGFTGVINTWADLVIKYWQYDQMTQMVAPYKDLPAPTQFGSLAQSARAAQALEPDMAMAFIAFPGTPFSSPHHFAIFLRGTEPLTARLLKPVLVDAQTVQITDSRDMPWYVTALLVSQPLHFGDYGGMPLQILWALLDVITIVVLWSGLVLWWRKRKQPVEIILHEAVPDDSDDFDMASAKQNANVVESV
jgi:uncharacterized iron-regulated membrane protein